MAGGGRGGRETAAHSPAPAAVRLAHSCPTTTSGREGAGRALLKPRARPRDREEGGAAAGWANSVPSPTRSGEEGGGYCVLGSAGRARPWVGSGRRARAPPAFPAGRPGRPASARGGDEGRCVSLVRFDIFRGLKGALALPRHAGDTSASIAPSPFPR